MRRPYLLISGAWLMHAAAWFLPVITDSVTLPKGLPGWEAFRFASCAVWPMDGFRCFGLFDGALATLSAVTTVLFIFGSPWVVWRGALSLQRVCAWMAAVAFIINAHWYLLLFWSERSGFRIGYFFWWASFLLVAAGLFDLVRCSPAEEHGKSRSAHA